MKKTLFEEQVVQNIRDHGFPPQTLFEGQVTVISYITKCLRNATNTPEIPSLKMMCDNLYFLYHKFIVTNSMNLTSHLFLFMKQIVNICLRSD